MIPGSANPLLLAGAEDAGYAIERSVRFNSSDSAYLSKNFASAGNRKTWTWAGWYKISNIPSSGAYGFFSCQTDNHCLRQPFGSATLDFLNASASQYRLTTSQVFRDPSAWYHIILAWDTTQVTASNRVKIYINGDQITSFSTANYPSLNYESPFNSVDAHSIGREENRDTFYLDGYLADIHFIDGQALDPTSFGEFDDNGIWQPKAYTGSYGTNGFHLPFDDNSTAAALGTDTSGNGNTWTVNNLSILDGTVATSDAKPVLATTDNYGQVLGTGPAADSLASNLYLCVPLATNTAVNLTDQQPTGRTTSSLTVSNPGAFTFTTSSYKYYGGSLNLTGGNYLTVASGLGVFSGNFTLEGWFRRTGTASGMTLFDTWRGQTSGVGFYLWWFSSGLDLVKDSSTYYVNRNGTDLPINTWVHVALVRSGNTLTCYTNGTSLFTYAVADNWSSSSLNIGGASANGAPFVGQIQDVRVYNTAKYTANFSVSSLETAAGNDSLVDVPTNGTETDTGVGGEVRGNYATLNPLAQSSGTFSNGNLEYVGPSSWKVAPSTILLPSTGKYFVEATLKANPYGQGFGLVWSMVGVIAPSAISGWNYNTGTSFFVTDSGDYSNYHTGGSGTIGTFVTGTVIGLAIDRDTNEITVYQNGTSKATVTLAITSGADLYVFNGSYNAQYGQMALNFGQRPFAYTAPSGYKALCTANLPAPVVTKPSEYMDVVTYTGNGSTQTISGLEFSPDLVWSKARNASFGHAWFDSVRGVNNYIASESTAAESNLSPNGLTAFNSDGWTDSAVGGYNSNGTSYVAWTWDAGSSTVSNTDGSITSTVRANPSAGFSIVTYTGNGTSGATVGHGLGVKPSFLIVKNRDQSVNWVCYHKDVGATKYLALNRTNAETAWLGFLNNTEPTSSVITLGDGTGPNGSGDDILIYAFAPVDGYSAMGSFTASNGAFVYTGFRPRFLLLKCFDTAGRSWVLLDTARGQYNVNDKELYANLADAEYTTSNYDLVSNGFVVRSTGATYNTGTWIYAAFAEAPFQYARAR